MILDGAQASDSGVLHGKGEESGEDAFGGGTLVAMQTEVFTAVIDV
jgi:hypothetical protein